MSKPQRALRPNEFKNPRIKEFLRAYHKYEKYAIKSRKLGDEWFKDPQRLIINGRLTLAQSKLTREDKQEMLLYKLNNGIIPKPQGKPGTTSGRVLELLKEEPDGCYYSDIQNNEEVYRMGHPELSININPAFSFMIGRMLLLGMIKRPSRGFYIIGPNIPAE